MITHEMDESGVFALLAGVFKTAVRDARKGDEMAHEFLRLCAPDVYSRLFCGEAQRAGETFLEGTVEVG